MTTVDRTCPCGAPLPDGASGNVRYCSFVCPARPVHARDAHTLWISAEAHDQLVRAARSRGTTILALVDAAVLPAIARVEAQTARASEARTSAASITIRNTRVGAHRAADRTPRSLAPEIFRGEG